MLLDYCHYGDPICAVGSEPQDVNEHLNYFVEHNPEVIKWVAGMAKASDGNVSAKPSKPVAAVAPAASAAASAASHSSSSTATSSVAARPAKTGSAEGTPTLIPEASVTDGSAAAQQTGSTGAASSLNVALAYLIGLAATVVFVL